MHRTRDTHSPHTPRKPGCTQNTHTHAHKYEPTLRLHPLRHCRVHHCSRCLHQSRACVGVWASPEQHTHTHTHTRHTSRHFPQTQPTHVHVHTHTLTRTHTHTHARTHAHTHTYTNSQSKHTRFFNRVTISIERSNFFNDSRAFSCMVFMCVRAVCAFACVWVCVGACVYGCV